MRKGREVPGEGRDGTRVLEGKQCHRQEVQWQRRSLNRAPGLPRCAIFPEMREARPRAGIERGVSKSIPRHSYAGRMECAD